MRQDTHPRPTHSQSGDRRSLRPVRHIPAIAALVHRLVNDGDELQRAGTAARELYDRCFDIRHTVAALRASFNGADLGE